MLRGKRAREVVAADEKILRRCFYPVEEFLPDRAHLRVVEALAHHNQFERIVRTETDLLAPMRVEEIVDVELEEMRDQTLKGAVRLRLDRCQSGAERGQVMSAQRQLCDHAPASAAASLERPEQVRIRVIVRDAHRAVRAY